MRLDPHPEMMPVIPKVRPVKWWLWRLATIAVVVFVFAAAMVPFPTCGSFTAPYTGPGHGPPQHFCTLDYRIALRVEVALTGVVIALLLVGLGTLLDRRHRRGASLG
jgi:uncharacterized membrane protein